MIAVIFDMDGVIIDSAEVADQLLIECASRSGASLTDRDLQELSGLSGRDFWAGVKARYDLPFSVDHYLQLYDVQEEIKRYETLSPIPGVVELIDDLLLNDTKLGLATSASAVRMNSVLSQFDLTRKFSAHVCSGDVERGKPNPEAFLRCSTLLGAKPQECTVIEDSLNGILAAQRAGMKSIGYVGLPREQPDLSDADFVVKSFCELTYQTFSEGL